MSVVSFPGGNPPPPKEPSADEVLMAAIGKYKEVVVIGINERKAQCVSSVPITQAIFELSRALYRLHGYLEGK